MRIGNYVKTALRFYAASFVLFSGINAGAAVLGEPADGWVTDMGGGAVYYNNVFNSDSAGKQTENYVEYTPNSESVPVVVNGESVYGKRNILSAASYMQSNNLRPLIGINADFFSFQTGIPMGHTVVDGKLLSKENEVLDAIGFRKDGTAFIDKLGINTSVTDKNGKSIEVLFVNKWLQKGFDCVNLLTDDFSDTTKTDFNAYYLICSAVSGNLSLNSQMELKVEEAFQYDGAIKIPEGKYVLVMDPEGNAEYFNFLSSIAIGDTITFKSEVTGAVRHDWTEAEYATSSIGGRLLDNGELGSGFEAGEAPRTAVGIKENGNIVFYTLDGRQTGYSHGAQIAAIAERMRELGCVDALNLDGGGSTAIGAVFPGSSEFQVSNRPSDGELRSCANYLFLRDMREQTGIPWYVEWRDLPGSAYLAGSGLKLEATKVYDTGNYKMDALTGVQYTVENTDGAAVSVDAEGNITFSGTGKAVVKADGERYHKSFEFDVYESPDTIRVMNTATGEQVTALEIADGEMYTMELEAQAYAGETQLVAQPSLFRWELDGAGGTVNEDGQLSLNGSGTNGTLRVTAGGTTAEIPIVPAQADSFADMDGHWAKDVVVKMASSGIINGFDENGLRLFKPDEAITRIQFAAIVSKTLGLDVNGYAGYTLDFADADQIQPWALAYVRAMAAEGYITGRSEDDGTTRFDPDSSITRAEAFTIMGRLIDEPAGDSAGFSDAAEIPEWAKVYVNTLAASGIINGYSDNTIRPMGNITRAEAAALISKFE